MRSRRLENDTGLGQISAHTTASVPNYTGCNLEMVKTHGFMTSYSSRNSVNKYT